MGAHGHTAKCSAQVLCGDILGAGRCAQWRDGVAVEAREWLGEREWMRAPHLGKKWQQQQEGQKDCNPCQLASLEFQRGVHNGLDDMYIFMMRNIVAGRMRVYMRTRCRLMDARILRRRTVGMVHMVVVREQCQRQEGQDQHPTDGRLVGIPSVGG